MPDTLLDQRLTDGQKLRFVHRQHTNRNSADGGDSDEDRGFELKVFGPDILARVVKPHNIPGSGVVACNIRALVTVTVETTESQVMGF